MNEVFEERFWETAKSFMSPAMIAEAKSNPLMLETLRSKIASWDLRTPPTPDFSQTPDQMAEVIKASKAAHERDRNLPPRRPPSMNRRAEYVMGLQARREQLCDQIKKGLFTAMTGITGVPKAFSQTPLANIKRIRMLGTTFVVEDPTGRAESLGVYNCPHHGINTGSDLDALFPLGQILAFREPTFKPDQSGQGQLLRADSPSDIVFLRPDHPLLRDVHWAYPSPAKPLPASFDFKQHGNSLFKQKKYLLAVNAYSDGLAASPSDEQKLLPHLDRAQAHLLIGNFASAFRDASAVLAYLDKDVSSPLGSLLKATLRRARALEGLRLLDEAKTAYEAVREVDPSGAEGKDGVKRVEKMLGQSKTGEYDWQALESLRTEKDAMQVEVGDFVGPVKVVEFKERGGGRGVVATGDIKAGELVLVEKAFAVGRPQNDTSSSVLAVNLHLGRSEKGADLVLAGSIVSRLMDDPSTLPIFNSLYGGKDHPPSSVASFGALNRRQASLEDKAVDIDIARIEAISIANRYGITTAKDDKVRSLDSSSGLFLNASLFNHSCAPNALWTACDDIMIVRARAPIAAGEEVFVAYINTEADRKHRTDVLSGHFDTGCTCELCQDDSRDGRTALARRKKLLVERFAPIQNAFESFEGRPTRRMLDTQRKMLAPLVADLEKTYGASHGPVRPDLVHPYHVLAELHYPDDADFAAQANAYTLKSLEAGGAVIARGPKRVEVIAAPTGGNNGAEMCLNIAWRLSRSDKTGDDDEANRWIRAAMDMSCIAYGDSPKRFAERHKSLIEGLGVDWLVGLASTLALLLSSFPAQD
ncbi:hypothetical protein JCM10207_004811 [Rhodosporidiobolus poonsookiae]